MTHYDFPMGKMSDSEPCSSRLQLDLVYILVKTFVLIVANYDQIWLPIG